MQRLTGATNLQSYIRKSGGSSVGGRFFLGLAIASAFMSAYSLMQVRSAEAQIQFRKRQLSLPVVKLTQQQLVSPPWNHDNLENWLYRRVEVTGRPIHKLQMMVPSRQFACYGFEEVLPLVTKQDQQFQNRSGLIMSMGWVPPNAKEVTTRFRIENVTKQTFVGFVSQMDQHKNHSLIRGNAYHPGRRKFTCADMEDFVKGSKLLNQKEASVALIERLHETGNLDERQSRRRDVGCEFAEAYPHPKTESGALQLHKMPWDFKNDAKHYFIASLASLVVGASIF